MFSKIISTSIAVIFCVSAFSQIDSTKPLLPTITGSVDAYYRYNFSNPQSGATNNFTSFTNSQNSFELGMASIKADHSFGKASATIDLGFGRRAEEFSYANPEHSSLFAIKQAYVSYAISDKFKLTMGKWATHIGYELVDAYLNRNYSMDYMFSYGPFSHTGLKADISLGGKSAFMVGIANPTDNVTTTSSTKVIIGQFSTASKNDKLKAYLNYQGANFGSAGSMNQLDLIVTGAVTDKFSVGYNGTIQSQKPKDGSSKSWWGSALYFNVDPTSNFGLTLRGEYFDNKKGLLAIGEMASNIFDLTLSANFKVGNLTISPELRMDNSSEEIFEKADGAAAKSTLTGILAATYHF
ncbi:hypothetical protein BH11BAC6_BH11BAC6_01810 [soil metagenome]